MNPVQEAKETLAPSCCSNGTDIRPIVATLYRRMPEGRRASDREVDPVVESFVERRLSETRHMMRSEFTVAMLEVTNKVSRLADSIGQHQLREAERTTSFAMKLDQISADVTEMKPRVESLILNDAGEQASNTARSQLLDRLDRNRKWAIAQTVAFAGVVVALVAVLLAHPS